jgi:anti-sigma factor RsiW
MKTPDLNDPMTRWLDGAMTPGERSAFELEMHRDPALRAEAETCRELRALLRGHLSLEAPVPHPDFFNSQVLERIAELHRRERREARTPAVLGLLTWLMRHWALTGAAVALALGIFAWQFSGSDDSSQVLGVYVPDADVKARSFHDDKANAAVIVLDGLPDIPDDKPVSGVSPSRTENHPEVASTTLYDAKGGVLLGLTTDATGTPQIAAR